MKKLLGALALIIGLSVTAKAEITGFSSFPSGSNGNVQINNDGMFGADSTFTYSTTTKKLSVSSAAVTFIDGSTITLKQIRWADGTVQVSSGSTTSGALTGVTAGYGLSGGGLSGNVTLNLLSNATAFIQNTGTLQAGATVYTTTGTIRSFTFDSSTGAYTSVSSGTIRAFTAHSGTFSVVSASSGTIPILQVGTITAPAGLMISTRPASFTHAYFLGTSSASFFVPTQLKGTITNDDPAAGCYGEEISSTSKSFSNFALTDVYQNFLEIPLTPGDWDISGLIQLNTVGSANVTQFAVAISSYSGNTQTDHVWGRNEIFQLRAFAASESANQPIPPFRVKIPVATTFYIKAACTWSSGAPNMRNGSIRARRQR